MWWLMRHPERGRELLETARQHGSILAPCCPRGSTRRVDEHTLLCRAWCAVMPPSERGGLGSSSLVVPQARQASNDFGLTTRVVAGAMNIVAGSIPACSRDVIGCAGSSA